MAVLLSEELIGALLEASRLAYALHVVRSIVDELARYRPDLFVVYLGNNEVVGPYGAGTVFSPISASSTLIRASISSSVMPVR